MFVDWILKKVFFFPSEKVNVIGLHVQIRLQNWFDTIMSCASGLLALYFCCCCFQSMNAISSLKMFSALVNASPMYLNTARHRRALTVIQSLNSDSKKGKKNYLINWSIINFELFLIPHFLSMFYIFLTTLNYLL